MRRILALLPRHRIPMDTRPISVPSAQLALQPGDKRPRLESPRPPKRGKKKKHAPVESGSSEDVIFRDVVALLGKELLAKAEADGMEWESPFGFREEVELTVSSISSSGMSCSKVCAETLAAKPLSRTVSNLLRQVRGSPLPRRQKALGSSSFHSSCQAKSFGCGCTGMQKCTLSPTSSMLSCRIQN
jgi:hypothetical protein